MNVGSTQVGAFSIEVPGAHIYMNPQLGPFYDYVPWNLIGSVLDEAQLGNAELLDIGANVGDTLCHFRRISNAQATCIEPADHFFEMLERNSQQFENVRLFKKLLAPKHLLGRVSFSAGGQTGLSRESSMDADKWVGEYITLEEVVAGRDGPFILKSDTDGFDASIINSAIPLIRAGNIRIPIIFFEGPNAEQIQDSQYNDYINVCEQLQVAHYNILVLSNSGLPYCYVGQSFEALVSVFTALTIGYNSKAAICHYYDFLAIDAKYTTDIVKLHEPWPARLFRRT